MTIPPGWQEGVSDLTMMINERHARADVKELRVQLPVEYLIRLHSLKILKGREIRESVEAALDMYFESINEASATSIKTSAHA